MIIPVPVNGTSILPACRQQSFQSPCVLFLLTPYIQFFRKFCQFQLQSMYGIHSLLPPLWAHPGPVHPRLSSLGPLPQPHRPSVPPLTSLGLCLGWPPTCKAFFGSSTCPPPLSVRAPAQLPSWGVSAPQPTSRQSRGLPSGAPTASTRFSINTLSKSKKQFHLPGFPLGLQALWG